MISVPRDVRCQEWQPFYKNYTTDEGLPSNEVYDVLETQDGYLWFTTDNGLVRYNGYEFKRYFYEGIESERVFFDMLEQDGRIWMNGFNNTIFYFDSKNDKIIKIQIDKDLFPNLRPKLEFRLTKENLFINKSASEEIRIKIHSKILDQSIEVIRKEGPHIYLGFDSSNAEKNQIEYINIIGKDRNLQYFIKKFQYNSCVIYSSNIGCFIFSKENKLIFHENFIIDDIYIDQEGKLYCGLHDKKGLMLFENENELIYLKGQVILQDLSISGLHKDSFNNLWVTTLNKGIIKILSLEKTSVFKNSSGHNEIVDFYLDENNSNQLFVLSNGEYTFSNGSKKMKLTKSFDKRMIVKHFKYKEKTITLQENGLMHLDGKILKRQYSKSNTYLNVKKLIFIDDSIFCIGSIDFCKVDLSKNKNYLIKKNKYFDGEFQQNLLYLVGLKGLDIYDFKKMVHFNSKYSYLNERIDYLEILKDGSLLLGSKNRGLFLLKNEDLKYYDVFKQFRIDLLLDIIQLNNLLFLPNSKGIIILKYLNGRFEEVKVLRHGVDMPLGQIKKIKYFNGYYYCIMPNLVFKFSESILLQKNKEQRPPVIEKIEVENQVIDFKSKITLDYNQNDLLFYIAGLDFTQENDLEYAYSLNSEKFKTFTDKILRLTKLSPGNYTLKLVSKGSDKKWSKPLIYSFSISPPWWKEIWFYCLCFLSLLIIVILYFLRREKAQKIENAIRDEMTQLEKSALQAQMNPHFIFNSLNSIQKFILLNDKVEASEYLAKFAQLIRFNLKASNSQEVSLKNELDLLEIYAELEKLRFKEKFRIIIKNEIDVEKSTKIMIPPMLIQPILENSIVHGMSNVEQGLIVLEIKDDVDENQLIVTISDNGKGLNNNISENHISVGSKITRRRLEIINKTKGTSYEIKNMISDEGIIIGAEAKLIITYTLKN